MRSQFKDLCIKTRPPFLSVKNRCLKNLIVMYSELNMIMDVNVLCLSLT